jgi:hypothetical protein
MGATLGGLRACRSSLGMGHPGKFILRQCLRLAVRTSRRYDGYHQYQGTSTNSTFLRSRRHRRDIFVHWWNGPHRSLFGNVPAISFATIPRSGFGTTSHSSNYNHTFVVRGTTPRAPLLDIEKPKLFQVTKLKASLLDLLVESLRAPVSLYKNKAST